MPDPLQYELFKPTKQEIEREKKRQEVNGTPAIYADDTSYIWEVRRREAIAAARKRTKKRGKR